MMLLGDMKVDVTDGTAPSETGESTCRLFHRKLLETNELDEVRVLQSVS